MLALVEAQQPSKVSALADLLRGAIAAHLNPLDRDTKLTRSSGMNSQPSPTARLVVRWTPAGAAAIGAAMVLIDFWFGQASYRLIGFSAALSREEQLALPRVRVFQYGELYDLTLHMAMLGVAVAAALLFAALARRVTSSPARPSV